MTFLKNKIKGIRQRWLSRKYGMFYWKNADYKIPNRLTINGEKVNLYVKDMHLIEFTGICINDCYKLRYFQKKFANVKTIIDVGANQGMFIIAARQNFPKATIHCYEPNPFLKEILSYNAEQLSAKPYFEAVMENDCMVNLNFTDSDLATTACESKSGNVKGSSLSTLIHRIGKIDILKLDCEGTEWQLLKDVESWKNIRALSMEYHLWGKKNSKLNDLYDLLDLINFKIIEQKSYNSEQGMILAINKVFNSNGK